MIAERRWRRLQRQLWELQAWRNVTTTNIEHWTVSPPDAVSRPIRLGERWDIYGTPVHLRTELAQPAPDGALLDVLVDGDGLVYLDGVFAGAISLFEREIPLQGARRIEIEVSPNDSFGLVGQTAHLKLARLVEPNNEMRLLFRELSLALEFCADLPESDVVAPMLDAVEEALTIVSLPSDAATVLHRTRVLREELVLCLAEARSLSRHYGYEHPKRAIEHLLVETEHFDTVEIPSAVRFEAQPSQVLDAVEHLRQRVETMAQRFPSAGELSVTSHAHLDVAWLWPLAETRRKIRHTFANVVALMEHYPAFRFTASSAQLYAYVQHDDPDLFEQVRGLVKDGRIEPIGGMWLEPDCNLPSGESLARHLLIGQRYFAREFGRRSTVAWLPDSFGLSGNLPQIVAGGGMRSFFTQKLSWNDTNRFPHDLWRWEGIDGTALVAHSFDNPVGGYNGQMTPGSLAKTWRNYRGKALHATSLYAFGMGDGGRGPTKEMLERATLLERYPALPRLTHATVEKFFAEIDGNNLPSWVGELYLEFHRGTYTTQSRIKRLNRQAEHRLQEAETACVLAHLGGAPYPKAEFEEAWTTLLRNQFHDILPGSSIHKVNEESQRELEWVVDRAIQLRDAAIDTLGVRASASAVQANGVIRVFNPQGFSRPLSCVVDMDAEDGAFFTSSDGTVVPWQRTAAGQVLLHRPDLIVPGVGAIDLRVKTCDTATALSTVRISDRTLENDLVRVAIASDGSIQSLFDKRAKREVFSAAGNDLRIFDDLPAAWEAWNLTDTSYVPGEPVETVDSIEVVERGPLRVALEVRRRYGSSSITQIYQLREGSARVDVVTDINWHERRKLLRALFPLTVRSDFATFETCFGAVRRPTHRNTSWDTARYEVPGHRWADLSEPGYGVSLLNDGRYGHSALGSTLGLTLLRSPRDPDPLADIGRHTFTYSIYPHLGDWHEADTLLEAIDLNSPLIGPSVDAEVAQHQWIDIDGLTLATLKLAEEEDDLVLRLYDPYGRHGTAVVRPGMAIASASMTNLLEEVIEQVEMEPDGSIRIDYGPFQVLTLRMKRS